MKVCPVCSREFPDNVKFCPNDGSNLRAKSPAADLVGQVVADRYHITKKLGEGGMGAVYLGEHVKMGRKSAIKVMSPAMAHDPDAVSRFNREAANASRISHPNVCQIYDFGETADGLIYLAMEFIEGSSLTDVVEKEGALPPVRAASILRQAANALGAAHELGIVHRDLKPDNIMVVQGRDGSDIVKVVDFGIAKAVAGDESGQKVTKTGLVVGTPEYMSPEQLSGDKLDGRSDIYSLGLVLYRMLTGVLPFQADSAQETMIKRLTDEPMPLEVARPDIAFPPKLQAVLDQALARLPSERYHNAVEFGRDVMDAVAGLAETRADVARLSTAATQMMDGEAALKTVTKRPPAKQAAPAAAAAAAAPRKFPLVPVLGGVGVVAALAAVAVLAMGRGPGPSPDADRDGVADASDRCPGTLAGTQVDSTGCAIVLAGADADGDRVLDANDRCPNTPAGTRVDATGCPVTGPPPPGRDADRDGVPDANDRCANTPAGTRVDASGCPAPQPPPVTVSVEDSINAAVRADQAGRTNEARRLARWVFYRQEATNKQKADAAELVATTYDNDPAQAIEWLRNALQYATGTQRTRIQSTLELGGTP